MPARQVRRHESLLEEHLMMSGPPPLTTMTEREWVDAWEEQQTLLDRVGARQDAWLPNVVERRGWGAVRWTSGRPDHAAATGQAVPETFAVLRPDTSEDKRAQVAEALTLRPAAVVVLGKGLRRSTLLCALLGALAGMVVLGALAAAGDAGAGVLIGLAVLGLALGAAVAAVLERAVHRGRRSMLLQRDDAVRVVTGRYAPPSWERLLLAVTAVENSSGDPDAVPSVHAAVWEAAGLLLSSSDHGGVEVLADGVERLR